MPNHDPCDDSHASDCIHHVTGKVKYDPLAKVMESPDTAWFCDRAKSIIGGDGQRRQDYGDALDSFEAIAKLWSVVLGIEVTAEQVALCQALLKMGRLLNKPNHEDSWVDIIGYAALGGDIAMRPGRNGNTVNPA